MYSTLFGIISAERLRRTINNAETCKEEDSQQNNNLESCVVGGKQTNNSLDGWIKFLAVFDES